MFTIAEIPAWPPYWIFKMAAIYYKFGHISASDHPLTIFKKG